MGSEGGQGDTADPRADTSVDDMSTNFGRGKRVTDDSRRSLDEDSSFSEYDRSSTWISNQVESGLPLVDPGPFLTGVVKFALIWNLLSLAYVVTRWDEIEQTFLFAGALFVLWVNVAPYLLWYYDKSVLPRFFAIADHMVVDSDSMSNISEKYNKLYADFDPLYSLFWGLGFLVAGVFAIPLFEANGMTGSGRVFLWTTLAFGAYVGAVLGESGFSAVVTTVLCIREVSTLQVDIKPLHPDGLGGLSAFGYFAIRTTVLWSSASLLSPMAFQMASASLFDGVIFLVTGTYIATILFSFIYPTLKINRRAKSERDRELVKLRQEYVELEKQLNDRTADERSPTLQQDLQRLRNRYDDYDTVQLYPMQIGILSRLIGSVLLPLCFLLLEFYLPNLL